MQVASATTLSVAGCVGGQAGITDFGTVLPGSTAVTTGDCTVGFGSTNDTAMLRLSQLDGAGAAMHRPPAGPLDPTFGTAGVASANFLNDDFGWAVAQQPDGKVVVGGWNDQNGSADWVVARFTTAGALDSTFGTGGKVTIAAAGWNGVYSLAIQDDGRILATGFRAFATMLTIGLRPDGTIDSTWGTSGTAQASVGGAGNDFAIRSALQRDGKLVVTGQADFGSNNGSGDVGLLRYTTNGTLDPTFGAGGTTATSVGALRDIGTDVAVQADGRIVVGAITWDTSTDYDMAVLRYLPDGSLDTSFGSGGNVVVPISGTDSSSTTGDDMYTRVAVQPDGRVVAALANRAGTAGDWEIMRFTTSGALDTTFDGDGKRTLSFGAGSDEPNGVVVQPDGAIVVAGEGNGTANMARFRSDGSLDTAFNGTGLESRAFGDGSAASSYGALQLGHDGKYVTGGGAPAGGGVDLAATIHTTTTVANFAPAVTDWTAGTNLFGGCLRAVSAGAVTDATTWPATGSCGAVNADPWRPIAATSALAGSKVALAPSGSTTATAHLRFGIRTAGTQPPGGYVAPVRFDVVAPAA